MYQINYSLCMLCFVYLAKENHDSDLRQLLSGAVCVQQTICVLVILLHLQKAVRFLLLVPMYVDEFPYESVFKQYHFSFIKSREGLIQGKIKILF